MKDHTFSAPCVIITDFVMEARPFFESQIKIKDSTWYLLSKILVLQQSAVSRSLVGSSHCEQFLLKLKEAAFMSDGPCRYIDRAKSIHVL